MDAYKRMNDTSQKFLQPLVVGIFGTSRKALLYVRYVIFQRLMSLKNYFGLLPTSLRLSTTVEAMLVIAQTISGRKAIYVASVQGFIKYFKEIWDMKLVR